jgi:hypothetical protein
VASQRHFTLDLIAILGFDEVRTDEEQDDIRRIESSINCLAPLISGRNLAIVPLYDSAIALVHN